MVYYQIIKDDRLQIEVPKKCNLEFRNFECNSLTNFYYRNFEKFSIKIQGNHQYKQVLIRNYKIIEIISDLEELLFPTKFDIYQFYLILK
jgi:hypothetical protein